MKKNNKVNGILKRFAPALCALVLAVGGLWAGTLEMGSQNDNGQPVALMSSRTSNSEMKTYANTYSTEFAYDTTGFADGVSTYGAQQQEDRKLVRTADVTLRTNDYDGALQKVQQQAQDMGGYIENLYQYGETARRITLTLRVPSDRLDEFLGGVNGLGRVTSRSESTVDRTVEYADNQARLDTLYQKRDRLNELLAQAQTVSDLIEIESAIADTQYAIDSYETRQRSIDRQVDMSMVNVTLQEQEETVVNDDLTLAERIAAGFRSSVKWLGTFGRNVIVFAVMAAPAVAAIAVVWVVWRLIKKGIAKKNRED